MKKTLNKKIKISLIAMSILMSAVIAQGAGIDQTYGSQMQNMKGFYGPAYTPQSAVNPCYANGVTGNGLRANDLDMSRYQVYRGAIRCSNTEFVVAGGLGYWNPCPSNTICYVAAGYIDACTS